MEEILASIRRIIADDEAGKASLGPVPNFASSAAPAGGPQTATEHAEGEEFEAVLDGLETRAKQNVGADVLELTEAMQSKGLAFDIVDGPPDVIFDETEEAHELRPHPSLLSDQFRSFSGPAAPDHTLLSPRASAAVDMSFNSLAHTVLAQNARTLEDLVREMLKPMLKSWLDENLPNMVERLVRAEIERVSRGRG